MLNDFCCCCAPKQTSTELSSPPFATCPALRCHAYRDTAKRGVTATMIRSHLPDGIHQYSAEITDEQHIAAFTDNSQRLSVIPSARRRPRTPQFAPQHRTRAPQQTRHGAARRTAHVTTAAAALWNNSHAVNTSTRSPGFFSSRLHQNFSHRQPINVRRPSSRRICFTNICRASRVTDARWRRTDVTHTQTRPRRAQ